MANRTIITLTTDFGLTDPYVGIMKGVILSHAENATIVDLCHLIQPQDIQSASLTLQHSYPFFPGGSVHLVVVDPGVGSNRNIICLKCDRHFFIGPDNGVLTPFLDTCSALHLVANEQQFLPSVSHTFHGRDIMAPIAGHLASGTPVEQIGPPIAREQCRRIQPPEARISPSSISGTIIHIDNFGNLRSSITAADLDNIDQQKELSIHVGFNIINKLTRSYAEGNENEALALIDSQEHLEIAVKNDSGAKRLNIKVGDRIVVRW